MHEPLSGTSFYFSVFSIRLKHTKVKKNCDPSHRCRRRPEWNGGGSKPLPYGVRRMNERTHIRRPYGVRRMNERTPNGRPYGVRRGTKEGGRQIAAPTGCEE